MTREELKRCIEIADRVLWETGHGTGWNWPRDYAWLQTERARLVRELRELDQAEISDAFASFANSIDRKSPTPMVGK